METRSITTSIIRPSDQVTYDLKQYNGNRHVRTVLYNTSYQLAKGIKMRLEASPLEPNTYFKITKNKT